MLCRSHFTVGLPLPCWAAPATPARTHVRAARPSTAAPAHNPDAGSPPVRPRSQACRSPADAPNGGRPPQSRGVPSSCPAAAPWLARSSSAAAGSTPLGSSWAEAAATFRALTRVGTKEEQVAAGVLVAELWQACRQKSQPAAVATLPLQGRQCLAQPPGLFQGGSLVLLPGWQHLAVQLGEVVLGSLQRIHWDGLRHGWSDGNRLGSSSGSFFLFIGRQLDEAAESPQHGSKGLLAENGWAGWR